MTGLGGLLLASLAARAHVGAPVDAVDVHAVGGEERMLEASIGVFWTEDGDDWRWVCHEAITTPEAVLTPRYAVAGRRWVASLVRLSESRTLEDAVYWTDDGCSWSVSTGLTGREVREVAIDELAEVSLAVTHDEGVSANAIYRSTDGGQSFSPVLEVPDQILTSVVLGPSALGTAMVGGVDAAGQGWLHWSADRGETWQSHAVCEGEVVAMALHPTDPDIGYAVVDGVAVETLLRTDDRGASVSVVLDPDGAITDVEVEPSGATWVSFSGTAYLHAADGIAFELVTTAPPGIGIGLHDGRALLATRFELVNNALSEGTLEDGFEPTFSFFAVDGPLDCPADTEGAETCTPLYPLLEQSLGLGDPVDTGEVDASEGTPDDGAGDTAAAASPDEGSKPSCGCAHSSAALLLLPLGLFARRPAHHRPAEGEGGHPVTHGRVEVPRLHE